MSKLALILSLPVLLAPFVPWGGLTAEEGALPLLEKAIRHQGPEEFAQPGAIKDLTVSIAVRAWNYAETPPQKFALEVRRFLSLAPELFRSEWRSTAGTQIQGFDGKRYWYADEEVNRFLLGDDTAKDREAIRQEIDETKHLLRLFFLANLKGSGIRWTRKAPETLELFREPTPCEVLHRVNAAPGAEEPHLTLWFDARTMDLRKAFVDGEKKLLFYFQYDEQIQPRVKGVLFPFRIHLWEQPPGVSKPRRSVIATVNAVGGVNFNAGLPAELFKRPKPD